MQLHFLPWVTKPIARTIGPVTLTPWQQVREHLDKAPRAFFDHYFTRYLDHDETPIDEITIASITDDALADITAIQRATIRSSIDALTFASIMPNLHTRVSTGNHFGTPNSERFQLITQLTNLRPGIAVSTRGVTHAWGIDDIHFCMPWDAGSTDFRTNDELLNALGTILNNDPGEHTRNRIYRTLEWFRLAHTGSPETSDESRVVMMTTAFETLLEPDDPHAKSGPLAQQLHELTHHDDLTTIKMTIGKKTYDLNPIGAWFCTFYDLRNKVIHGDGLTTNALQFNESVTHLDVADVVLWETISWELVDRQLLGERAREYAEWLSNAWSKQPASPSLIRTIMRSLMGINTDDYHKGLGWQNKIKQSDQ
jgi:hypothetical protein